MCEHSTLLHSCRLRPTRTSKISGCGLAGSRFPLSHLGSCRKCRPIRPPGSLMARLNCGNSHQ